MKRRVLALIILVLLAATAVAAQYAPVNPLQAILVFPSQRAILLLSLLPDNFRVCGSQAPDKSLHGCVTAGELRAKAEAERRKR